MTSDADIDERAVRHEPAHRTVVVAAGGVLGGALFAWIGGWIALRLAFDSVELPSGDTLEEAFMNGIRLIGYLVVWGFGVMTGYVAGAGIGPLIVAAAFRWGNVGRTALWWMLAQSVAIPLAIGALTLSSGFHPTDPWFLIAVLLVGFVAPGLARRRATRVRPEDAQ